MVLWFLLVIPVVLLMVMISKLKFLEVRALLNVVMMLGVVPAL